MSVLSSWLPTGVLIYNYILLTVRLAMHVFTFKLIVASFRLRILKQFKVSLYAVIVHGSDVFLNNI